MIFKEDLIYYYYFFIRLGTLNAAFHIFGLLLVLPVYCYSLLNRTSFNCLEGGLLVKVPNEFWFNRLRIYCQSLFFYHLIGFLSPLIIFNFASSETGYVLGLNAEVRLYMKPDDVKGKGMFFSINLSILKINGLILF